jgi:hypothetical protein
VPVWEVTMAHAAATLLDGRYDASAAAAALRRCERTLLAHPARAFSHLLRAVYPAVVGTDHARLSVLYSTLKGCATAQLKHMRDGGDGGASAGDGKGSGKGSEETLVRWQRREARLTKCCVLAERLPKVAAAVDLKKLLGEGEGEGGDRGNAALAEVRAHVTLANVHSLAKLVKELPAVPTDDAQEEARGDCTTDAGVVLLAPATVFAVLLYKNMAAGKGSFDDRYNVVAEELLERLGVVHAAAAARFLALQAMPPPPAATAGGAAVGWASALPSALRVRILHDVVMLLHETKSNAITDSSFDVSRYDGPRET